MASATFIYADIVDNVTTYMYEKTMVQLGEVKVKVGTSLYYKCVDGWRFIEDGELEYQEATCSVLLEHVEGILKEVAQLTTMMEKFRDEDRHPRLPLLLRHHAQVTSTFAKVRENILSMYQ